MLIKQCCREADLCRVLGRVEHGRLVCTTHEPAPGEEAYDLEIEEKERVGASWRIACGGAACSCNAVNHSYSCIQCVPCVYSQVRMYTLFVEHATLGCLAYATFDGAVQYQHLAMHFVNRCNHHEVGFHVSSCFPQCAPGVPHVVCFQPRRYSK